MKRKSSRTGKEKPDVTDETKKIVPSISVENLDESVSIATDSRSETLGHRNLDTSGCISRANTTIVSPVTHGGTDPSLNTTFGNINKNTRNINTSTANTPSVERTDSSLRRLLLDPNVRKEYHLSTTTPHHHHHHHRPSSTTGLHHSPLNVS